MNKKAVRMTSRQTGFTLVEIMIVVAIIALLAAIAVPGFLRARKRSQATRILNDLRLIEGAVSVYAIEKSKAANIPLVFSDLQPYLKKGTPLYNTGRDIFGRFYRNLVVDQFPRMSTQPRAALPM